MKLVEMKIGWNEKLVEMKNWLKWKIGWNWIYLIGSAATTRWRRGVRLRWGRRRRRIRERRRLRSCRKGPTTTPWNKNAPTRKTASVTRRRCTTATGTSPTPPQRSGGGRKRSSWSCNSVVTWRSHWKRRTPSTPTPLRRASPADCGCTRRRSVTCRLCWPCGFCSMKTTTMSVHCRRCCCCRTTSVCVDARRRSPCSPAWRGCVHGRCVVPPTPAEAAAGRNPNRRIECVSWPTSLTSSPALAESVVCGCSCRTESKRVATSSSLTVGATTNHRLSHVLTGCVNGTADGRRMTRSRVRLVPFLQQQSNQRLNSSRGR